MKTIWIQHWTESERGWGQRPDGISLHNTKEDAAQFVADYNAKFNNEKSVPDCYSFADGSPFLAQVEEELVTINGLGKWESNSWLSTNKKEGKVQY